jgi:hypothetical protein
MNYLAIPRIFFFTKMFSENEKEFPFSFPFQPTAAFGPKPKSATTPWFPPFSSRSRAYGPTQPNYQKSGKAPWTILHLILSTQLRPDPNPPAQPSARTGPSEPGLQPEAEAAMGTACRCRTPGRARPGHLLRRAPIKAARAPGPRRHRPPATLCAPRTAPLPATERQCRLEADPPALTASTGRPRSSPPKASPPSCSSRAPLSILHHARISRLPERQRRWLPEPPAREPPLSSAQPKVGDEAAELQIAPLRFLVRSRSISCVLAKL